MTIKDGFRFGLGLILAQILLGIAVVSLSIPTLYLVGEAVKTKVTETMLGGSSK
jgi:hypothetical protein